MDEDARHDHESQGTRWFAIKMGLPVAGSPKLPALDRWHDFLTHMHEELGELVKAYKETDLPQLADALVDIVYIVKHFGTAAGLPWAPLWDEVQRTNMLKEPGQSNGHKHGVVKPAGWQPPEIERILREYGWRGKK